MPAVQVSCPVRPPFTNILTPGKEAGWKWKWIKLNEETLFAFQKKGCLHRELFKSSNTAFQSILPVISPQNQASKQTPWKNNNKLPAFGTPQCRTREQTASDLKDSNR